MISTLPSATDPHSPSFSGLTSAPTKLLLLAVGALGVSCVATQLVLLRELLCAFAGNELVLGIVLGNWLLLMGLGAWIGRRVQERRRGVSLFLAGQILVALLPPAQVFTVRVLRDIVFVRGAAVGVPETFTGSFAVLLPYCVIAGLLLTLACMLLAEANGAVTSAGRVYVADSVGSVLGGAVVSLLLLRILDAFTLLAGGAVLNLALAVLLAHAWRRPLAAGAAAAALAIAVLVPFAGLDKLTTTLQHPGQEVLFRGNSPYGRLVVTRADTQLNFLQNGLPVIATPNTEQVEEAVHYAMAQRPDARRVLLLGGGVAGAAKELLKYRADVTCVELDPLFLELGRRFLPENLADPRIRVVNTDGRRFVQTSGDQFDVIIVDLADPVTAQLNRFHTAEFVAEAKRALATNGVLALAVGRYENFVSLELARVLATAHRTLRSAFANVVMLPGGRVFFLASDGRLGPDIAERLERAQVNTRFVNRHYLDSMLTVDRMADLERTVAQPAAMNRDFNPLLYFRCVRHWASQFDARLGVVSAALALALAVYVLRLRGAAAALFASGFAASSLEVVLLLGFQALCGSVYYQLGIIVTVFMAGLAMGAAWANHDDGRRGLLMLLALLIAVLALLLPLALKWMGAVSALRSSALLVQLFIGLLTFALAVLVGAQFPAANRVEAGAVASAASRLYTADFVGASLGALLASAWLIPALGVTMMCAFAAGLNLLGAAAVWLRRARPV